jgi:diacylglycerol kinase
MWLRLSRQDWALLVLAMALVLVAELVNTALETVTDLKSPEYHPQARVVKDVGAAAVLTAAAASIVIGLLILGPPLLSRIRSWWVE